MLTRVGKSCGNSSGSTFRRALQGRSVERGCSLKWGGHVLKSLYQFQAGLATCDDLANVPAHQELVDFWEEIGPFLREIAYDNVLESGGELDGDRSGGGRGKEREERRLERVTIRLGNRGTIWANL